MKSKVVTGIFQVMGTIYLFLVVNLTLFSPSLSLSFCLFLAVRCCVGAFSSCGAWASHCNDFSCCRAGL